MSALPQRLKAKLKEKHLSAHALEKLAGLKPSVIQNILQGKSKNPTAHTLQAISRALNCRIDELIGKSFAPNQTSDLWNPALYQEAIEVANELFAVKQLHPSKEQALQYIDEIYDYSVKANNSHIDRRFAQWLIERQGL